MEDGSNLVHEEDENRTDSQTHSLLYDNEETETNFILTATRNEINIQTKRELEEIDVHSKFISLIQTIEDQVKKDKLTPQNIRDLDDKLFAYAKEIHNISSQDKKFETDKDEHMQRTYGRLIKDVHNILHKEQSETKIILRLVGAFAAALLLCYLTGGLSMIVTAASQCAPSAVAPSLKAISVAAIGTIVGAAAVWFGTKPKKPVGENARFFNTKKSTVTFATALKEHYQGVGLP